MCAATEEKEKKEVASEEKASDADSITRKFGLEAGLWKVRIWSFFPPLPSPLVGLELMSC
jgi:hypothetical protein